MKLRKVTKNGRVTIPVELRKKYTLLPGRKVRFEIEEDGIRITPLFTTEEIKATAGFLGTKGKLLRALMEEKKKEKEVKNQLFKEKN